MPDTYIDVGANATYANTSNTNEIEYQSIFVVPKSTIRLPIHFCCAKIHNPAPNPAPKPTLLETPLWLTASSRLQIQHRSGFKSGLIRICPDFKPDSKFPANPA